MKFKIALSILTGSIIGIVVTLFVVERTTDKTIANLYLVGVMEQANVALHIRAGKQAALLTNIESELPSYVIAINNEFKGQEASMDALWMVKAYYQRNEIAIPREILDIMNSLPPMPPTSCQLRLQALDDAPSTTMTDPEEAK